MTITKTNFTDKCAVLYKGAPVDLVSLFNRLKSINDDTHLIDRQNINNWVSQKHIALKVNGKALPLMTEFLKREGKKKNPNRSLHTQLQEFIDRLTKGNSQIGSAQLSSSIIYQKHHAKITTPVSSRTNHIENLGVHLNGLFKTTRYRFNDSTPEHGKIAQEICYIYQLPIGNTGSSYPHFIYYYRESNTALSQFRGICLPTGQAYWLMGFDQNRNHRMRVTCLTGEDNLSTTIVNKHHSQVRGGLILSDTKEQGGVGIPCACRVIFEKQKTMPSKLKQNPTPFGDVAEALSKYAEEEVKFFSQDSYTHPSREEMLLAIDNQRPLSKDIDDGRVTMELNRNLLMMPQPLINRLLPRTKK